MNKKKSHTYGHGTVDNGIEIFGAIDEIQFLNLIAPTLFINMRANHRNVLVSFGIENVKGIGRME